MDTADRSKASLSPNQLAARQIARRLIDSRRPGGEGTDAAARTAADACSHLYQELSRWVGTDGCHALFTRALAEARTEFPALGKIQLRARAVPYVEGIAETIMAHGDALTAQALESMLARLIELLGRLIGDDMTVQLIDQSLATSGRGQAASDSRREEA